MTTVQRFAQIFGWGFVLVAVLGFFTSGGSMEADPATAPHLLGLFPVNLLHNLVHLLFGVWGIAAARSVAASRTYTLVGGAAYLGLAVIGLIAPSLFGIMPIGGNDVWLHVLLGAGLLAGWFTARSDVAAETRATV